MSNSWVDYSPVDFSVVNEASDKTFNKIQQPHRYAGVSLFTRIKNANAFLHDLGKHYHSKIPLQSIFDYLEDNAGLTPLQEDKTKWSGILAGRNGNTTIDLRDDVTGREINQTLSLTWYRMESGRYEVTAYVS